MYHRVATESKRALPPLSDSAMRLVKSLLSRRAFENHTVAPVLLPPCTCRRSAQFSSRSTSAEIPSAPSSISALDTIFAPATGRSKSAISILRISGPKAVDIYHAVTTLPRSAISRSRTASSLSPPTPRRALLRRIIHPRTRETLDEGIVLYFPGEHSPISIHLLLLSHSSTLQRIKL